MAESSIRTKMPVSERAKQFMPFAAVKGVAEALSEKERIKMPRRELSEEMTERLNETLKLLRAGDIITAVYYYDEEYLQLTGRFKKADEYERALQIEEVKIPFEDLYEVITSES